MPLLPGKSTKAFSHNVKVEMDAGKPQKQALAIAYSEKRKHMAKGGKVKQRNYELEQAGPNIPGIPVPMAEGGEVDENDDLMPHIVDEFMKAFETKDKSLLMEALTALVLHIQDMDQEQDKESLG